MEEKDKEAQENPNLPLEEIAKECMDSAGYIIFAGVMSNDVNEKGDRLVNYRYRRYQLGYEDVKTAVQQFKEHFLKDVRSGMNEEGPTG